MKPIVKWQYEKLEDTLGLLEEHLTDQDCPCNSEGEACGRKHLKRAEAYAAETIAILARSGMSDEIEKLAQLAGEAKAFRLAEERQLCGQEVSQDDLVDIGWAGNWRKHFENLVIGACDVAVVEDPGDFIPWLADRMKSAAVDSALGEEPRWCFGVKTVNKDLGNLARSLGYSRSKALKLKSDLELPVDICKGQAELFAPAGVLDPYGSRCRDPKTGLWSMSEECGFEPAGIRTDALGMDGLTRYDFEFRIVSLDKLLVSHDPFNFEPNPEYPGELQPRLRERAATRIQVEKIAANLEPDALLTDFHTLDRGSPIIGPEDMAVEAGNGRVMGLIRSVREYPAKYELYRERLRDRARDFGLRPQDVDAVERPVLLRLRVTDVDRVAFTQEANTAATLAPSAIENARTDAEKITLGMLQELVIGENESIEDALRATRNKSFATRFLQKLPENVQASLVDAQGYLNRDGVHRMAMAIFVSAFQGDTGLRLAEKAFESLDMDVRNAINAIARSLGPLAQAEALIRSGERDTKLSIGDDLAQAVAVYSAIKHTPELTVDKYLAQGQLLERELTDFEEQVLLVFDQYRRSPKKLGTVLGTYARKVIDSPPPAQATLLPGVSITKEQLWEDAARGAEAEIPTMFEDLAREICELPSARYQYLSTFFAESLPEAVLYTTETRVERKIDAVLAQLEQGIIDIQESDNFRDFMDTLARFHNYSLGNVMLITLQKPTASRVAGYATWKGLERNVKRGEKGIMILAPCFPAKPKDDDEEEEDQEERAVERRPIYFKVVYVFDIGQTEGKEIPRVEVPVIIGEETRALFENGLSYAAKLGITVSSIPKPEESPDLMGYWLPADKLIWVRPDVPQDQRTKTLLHETAHAMCEMRGARDAEVMAESVAYTVTNHFGFDTGVRSFPYVALWAQDVKVLKSNLETIRKVATEMIEGIEQVSHLAEALVKIHPEYDKLPYARPVPKEIIVYKTTIEKHYLSDEDIHPGSIRVVKPEEDILVYLACVKGDTWEPGTTTCSPNPSVYKTIVPRTPKYLAEVNEWKDYGVKVTYKESVGVEPQVDEEDEELAEVVRALEKAEVVNA